MAALGLAASGRLAWGTRVTRLYSPPSSSFGLMQFTEGTFREASHLCIHDHKLVREGKWYDWNSCWFNTFSTRMSASDSIETAAAYLHQSILSSGFRGFGMSPNERTSLAGLIHLCGVGRAKKLYRKKGTYANRYCGSHSVGRYISRLKTMHRKFKQL